MLRRRFGRRLDRRFFEEFFDVVFFCEVCLFGRSVAVLFPDAACGVRRVLLRPPVRESVLGVRRRSGVLFVL